ncbi:hypothetical protein AB2C60_25505 [Pseudomonas aeruginosa]
MNKANECTCPSGDGSLRHPCPAHPAVEQAGTNVGHGHVFPRADGVKMRCGGPGLCSECSADAARARAALAQPSPASGLDPLDLAPHAEAFNEAPDEALKPDQAEAERPEFDESEREDMARIAFETAMANGISLDSFTFLSNSLAERYERIVGALRAVIAQLRQHKIDYMDSGQETYRALQNEMREREAEIARLDGLVSGRTAERDAALAEVAGLRSLLNSLLCYVERDINRMRSDRDKSDNKEIYDRSISLAMERLKAAQNAVFTTEPGCDTAVELAAQTTQAQHSVPEGWVQSLPLKDHQPCKPNEDRANGYTIPIYSRPVLVEEALRKLRAVLCDPIGNVVIDGSDGDREEVQRALGMLAAAPGKEGV